MSQLMTYNVWTLPRIDSLPTNCRMVELKSVSSTPVVSVQVHAKVQESLKRTCGRRPSGTLGKKCPPELHSSCQCFCRGPIAKATCPDRMNLGGRCGLGNSDSECAGWQRRGHNLERLAHGTRLRVVFPGEDHARDSRRGEAGAVCP